MPEIVKSLHSASHQRGSRHATATFIAGQLDLPMHMAFTDPTQPVLLIRGHDAYNTPVVDSADLL